MFPILLERGPAAGGEALTDKAARLPDHYAEQPALPLQGPPLALPSDGVVLPRVAQDPVALGLGS